MALVRSSSWSEDVIAGAYSGLIARLLCAPFDVLKIRQQLSASTETFSLMRSFKDIIAKEGVFALWKGNLAATYLWMSYSFDNSVGQMIGRAITLFFAGSVAGMTATAVTYPLDITRTQFTLQGTSKIHDSMMKFVAHTIRSRGIRGMYAGLGPSMFAIVPSMGLNFSLYENFKMLLSTVDPFPQEYHAIKSGFVGGLAGGMSKLIIFPLDTAKRRMQAQSLMTNLPNTLAGQLRYKTTIHCLRTIVREEGVRGLYKGIVPTLAKSVSSVAVSFAAFESAKSFLREIL